MGRHPDDEATISRAPAGVIADEPENVTNIVHEQINGSPNYILEKWAGAAWFYASVDSFQPVEPAEGDTPRG